jgi:hypothetical protein
MPRKTQRRPRLSRPRADRRRAQASLAALSALVACLVACLFATPLAHLAVRGLTGVLVARRGDAPT